jgi:hypothetical protein
MNEGSPKKKPQDGRRKADDGGLKTDDSSMLRPPSPVLPGWSFSGWPMIIGWAAMLIFTFHACTHMVAAGDTWVAMACGRHFVNHGVDTVEPFSANSHKPGPTPEEVKTWPGWAQWITKVVGLGVVKKVHPTGWINQNWLTHVIFYKLTTMLGSEQKPYFDALVYWKFAIYILVVICLYFTSRLLGVNRALAVVFACAAMFIGRSFLDVRPAGFSNLMVPTFILVLLLTSYRNALYIWLLVPLVVFWSNVHGGYIYAFLMLVPFVAWHVIMALPKRWSIAVYTIGTWGVMCLMAHQVVKIEFLKDQAGPLSHDWVLYVFLVASAGMIALAFHRQVSARALVGFSVATSLVLFLLFLAKFFQQQPPAALTDYGRSLFWADVYGAMLAYAGVFAFAMILGVTVASVRDRIALVMPWRAVLHTVAAGAVAFFAMVIFNPFHLTNLTHTFVISVSAAAERWRDVHEWHRAFDWTNPVGTAVPFLVMYVFAWVCLAVWAFVMIGTARVVDSQTSGRRKNAPAERPWPKLDLALVVIAAMTIYMAIRSRRFIPIAAYAACPILALLVDHIIRVAGPLYKSLASTKSAARPVPVGTPEAVDRGFSGIDGWLILPALGLVLAAMGELANSAIALVTFMDPARIPSGRYFVNTVCVHVGLFIFVLIAAVRFFGKRRSAPITMIALIVATTVLTSLQIVLAILKTPGEITALWLLRVAGPAVVLVIWIPSFLVSQRVKAVFVRPAAPLSAYAWSRVVVAVGAAMVVFFGAWWVWKFKWVYLDYWPADPVFTSVFMRLTASDAKPFYACQFIRDNKLSGNMFNYWTEGGFIAWGQTPDPNTGRTPLQLFMDGRAQAAYDRTIFDEWTDIISGGPIVTQAARAGRSPKQSEYPQIAEWISARLQAHDVWVVLMPSNQFDTPFVTALEVSPDWRTVFTNNKQKLFVDIKTDQGRRLYENMMAGRLVYPDAFSADMAMGHNLLLSTVPDLRKRGLDLTVQAFKQDRSPAPVLDMLLIAARYEDLRKQVDDACLEFATDFESHNSKYAGHDGYNLRIEAARLCLLRLEQSAKAQGDTKAAEVYGDRIVRYVHERNHIADTKRW